MSLQSPEFKYVTEERIQDWKASGSESKLPDPIPMSRFIFELCWAMVRGELPFQKCKVALDSVEFVREQHGEDLGSVFADTIAHMGQDLTMPVECRTRLIKLTKWLVESALVPSKLLQECCEEEFLWDSELSKIKPQDLKSKEVRVNTRLLYQQTKFNLLREESEGYAKLVTLLCQCGLDATSQGTSAVTVSTIKSLIGHFDLDPNRVFDIVLECFELYPNNDIFYNLIPIFPKSHAAQILGFKFQYYQRTEINTAVPPGLLRLTALLVKSEFIDLDSIYSHLLPNDDEAFEHCDAFVAKYFDEVGKIGKINLAATGKELMDDEKQDVTIDLFTALDMESEAVKDRALEVENNQKLGLLIGFLSVDDWYHAQILLDRLSRLNPVEHIEICQGIFRLIEKTMSTAYSSVCRTSLRNVGKLVAPSSDSLDSTSIASEQSPFVDLPREYFQMLSAVGPYLYRDPILLQKICIVLRAYYASVQELARIVPSVTSSQQSDAMIRDPRIRVKEARLRLEEALGVCLLPSLQLIPANPAVGQEIWEVLSLLPYEVRFRLYGEWEKDDEQLPMILAAKQIAKLDTRRILKRLAKENLKQLGRMVAKLAHANPMTVLRTIVHQIEAYRDMITPVVDAFKYLTQLGYDVLEYVVIERLALGGREKLKDDGLNLADWLQSLASFWGHLCKKYPSMELRGLFQYLVNQLKRGYGIELVLLQELIQQMANVQYTENMTEEQLDAMAGSETLRYQATLFGMTRNNKALSKSTNRLRDSLLPKEESKLAIPLLLLIAQHRSMVIKHADAPYIKMVSEQFDRCHGVLLQYVDFLCNAVTPSIVYAQLIPSLNELVHSYHLDPEVVFLIYRPLMRLFKRIDEPEICWPLEQPNAPVSDTTVESHDVCLDLGSGTKLIMWSQLLDIVRSMLPQKAWNSLSPDLYATFWGLTLYDLEVPRSRYESEIAKQHAAIKALEEISDNSSIAITKRKKEKERIQELLDKLNTEYQKHQQHVTSVHQRLCREKERWLSSCPDNIKTNMEFLQRCIFPRCTFSMPDAVYCAAFVKTLHSVGTPFFNTVSHLDVLICKTLQPMICCCTEYEAGRFGRFLYETLKMAYHWKSDESIYERECRNMPGFAVYYRFPNSHRVPYSQFVRVHWKWSGRITRSLAQCLESTEYMEIRNALIVLTKISSIFPVIRKSGINLEKRVAKIKGDEREDLKVLATGVAAALAARKSTWVSEEEFGMGYIEIKTAASPAKLLAGNMSITMSAYDFTVSQNEFSAQRNFTTGNQTIDASNSVKDQLTHAKATADRIDVAVISKSESSYQKVRAVPSLNGPDSNAIVSPAPISINKTAGATKNVDEFSKVPYDETNSKNAAKGALESEARYQQKRAMQNPVGKLPKQEAIKEESKSGKATSKGAGHQTTGNSERDFPLHSSDNKQGAPGSSSMNGNSLSGKVSGISTRMAIEGHGSQLKIDTGAIKPSDDNVETSDSSNRQQKKSLSSEEQERLTKRRKGEPECKQGDAVEVRIADKERTNDQRSTDKLHLLDHERNSTEGQSLNRTSEKSKDKSNDKHDKEYREKVERSEKNRGEDIVEKSRDRSLERHGRERSVERLLERGTDRSKDDRNKPRHNEIFVDKAHSDERFHGQNLPPPPPLPPSYVPQSVGSSRRDEDVDRRVGNTRHVQRLSPRHDEKERRRSEENAIILQDDSKRRREDDIRDKKRDERDALLNKVDERERDKVNLLKDDIDQNAGSKRRKLKREHVVQSEGGGDYSAGVPPPAPPLTAGISQSFDARERVDRKGASVQHRAAYMEEMTRIQGKDASGKMSRRESDQVHEREWEEEKRQRTEAKRKHRK